MGTFRTIAALSFGSWTLEIYLVKPDWSKQQPQYSGGLSCQYCMQTDHQRKLSLHSPCGNLATLISCLSTESVYTTSLDGFRYQGPLISNRRLDSTSLINVFLILLLIPQKVSLVLF